MDRANEEGQGPPTLSSWWQSHSSLHDHPAPSQPGHDGTTTGLCRLYQAATEQGCCLWSTAEK